MGTIAKPYTFAAAGAIVAAQWNSNFDTFITEFNGKIANANIKAAAGISGSKLKPNSILTGKLIAPVVTDNKLNYDWSGGVQLVQIGASGKRVTRGTKTVVIVAGTKFIAATVDFATYNFEGNPAFTAAPAITLGCVEVTGTVQQVSYIITGKSNTAFNFEVRLPGIVGADTTFILLWEAIGNA